MVDCRGKPLPGGAECHDIPAGELVVGHRIVRTGDVASDELLEDFRSNASIGAPRRGLERQFPILSEGLSMYEDLEAARETAVAFPKLGRFVARVELAAGHGITFARWGARTHMTVWAEPALLRPLVTQIVPVRQ